MGNRWATVTMTDYTGRRYSLDVYASSTFDAAHMFVAHAKSDPKNGFPKPTAENLFEVAIDGKIHRVHGKALRDWILKEREERSRGPSGLMFSRRERSST